MGEMIEFIRAFRGTPFGPVLETAVALAILATLVRYISDRLPFISAGLRMAGRWAAGLLVRTARASARSLRGALTYERAQEPRWVKPLGLAMDLVVGSYFALLFFLLFVQFSAFVVYADGSAPWWKYAAAAGCALVLAVAAKVYTVQAREAWCEIRERYLRRGGPGTGGPKLLPSRTGPGNP